MIVAPLEAGVVHFTMTWLFAGVADVMVGASGVLAGVPETVLEGVDEPTLFVATTW